MTPAVSTHRTPSTDGLILAHLAGDYVLQTQWMATEKVLRWPPALVHGAVYGAAHLPVTRDPLALAVIAGTHAVIDRYRLAKYVVYAKNQLAPAWYRYPWARAGRSGYLESEPEWLTTWLGIVADNTLHLAINMAAVRLDRQRGR